MNKTEFIHYVKGIIDSELEKGRVESLQANVSNPDINLIGPLKLIKDALDSIQLEPTEFFPPLTIPGSNTSDKVPYFETCGCNPKNGGSGICGCVLGGITTTC